MKKSIALAPAVAIAISGFGVTAVSATTTPSPSPTPTETGTVTPEPAAAPVITVDPEVVEAEAVVDENQGVTVAVSGLEPGSDVSNSLTDEVVQADDQDNAVFAVYYSGPATDFEPGEVVPFEVYVTDADGETQTLNGSFTIAGEPEDDETESPSPTPTETETASPTPTPTEDDDAGEDDASEDDWTWNGAELKEGLNLESDRVTPEKFVDEGVAFAVRGCEPGQDVTFEVRAGSDDIQPYTATVAADENGIAVHGVKGLDADQAEAYIGEYTVTATCGENTWTDAFTVGYGDDDANPGGDDADENDNAGGNDLPRTGTELTGLAAGAGLLVIGAATMLLTRRRGAKTGPADI